MAWIVAAFYLRAAARFDKMEQTVVEKAESALASPRENKQ
jgi:uncharacterized membrane protein (DUF485 family)